MGDMSDEIRKADFNKERYQSQNPRFGSEKSGNVRYRRPSAGPKDREGKGSINMASVTTTGFAVCGIYRSQIVPTDDGIRRRYITADAGHALEILSHAIDHLTDELLHEGKRISAHNPQAEAIQMLMALNRQIYYECPIMPTFTERLQAFFTQLGGTIRNL